jgi:hypothetical protein
MLEVIYCFLGGEIRGYTCTEGGDPITFRQGWRTGLHRNVGCVFGV